jgi:NAD(P)-dependent dehydrogenase (short-subunit alcohol dehydrogenase family)
MSTWFITGISSGFGREMAVQLLERGDHVAGSVRDPASVSDLADRYGDQLWVAELDLTQTTEIRPLVDRAFDELGRIDVIVNNAGYGLFGAAEEATDEQVLHSLNTNLLGSMQVVRAAVPHLRAQGGGRIIQLSTFGGQAALPGGSMYHASKWGIEGFTEALVGELAPFGIGVTIVEPGGARTNFRYGSAQLGPEIEAYRETPAAMARGMLKGDSVPQGDPVKMVTRMIATVDEDPAPRRLVLGSDSFAILKRSLTERLAEVESQEASAAATDADDAEPMHWGAPSGEAGK